MLSATDNGTAVSSGDMIVGKDGWITRTDAMWTAATKTSPRGIVIEYEYGQPYPVDGADRIGMMLARHMLVATRIPNNAAAYSDVLGNYAFDETQLPFEAFKWIQGHRLGGFFG